jgi:transcriptional regulator with XRE-family HTH domain
MFRFLSEVERITERRKISRRELAKKIGKSPGYLTQVWRDDKPLTFKTLAKLEEALNFSFKIRIF